MKRRYTRGKVCNWCDKSYAEDTVARHHQVCPVLLAVRSAEIRAGRELTYQETREIRDRAREAFK